MILMSNSVVIIRNTLEFSPRANAGLLPFAAPRCPISASRTLVQVAYGQRPIKWEANRCKSFIPRAGDEKPKKKSWWQKFLLQEIDTSGWSGPDFGLGEEVSSDPDGLMETDLMEEAEGEVEKVVESETRFEAWKQRADAVSELRAFQENGRDPNGRDWEDWLDDSWTGYTYVGGGKGWDNGLNDWEKDGVPGDPPTIPEQGIYRNIKEWYLKVFDNPDQSEEDLTYEDKVFQYTARATAKFVALLLLVPWTVDFVVHDFVLVPFLNRYVEVVPLAAQLLDVRKYQKLQMIETLKHEKLRWRFEAEIGRAPELSDEELMDRLRQKARNLRDELRLENRKSFANIWSDVIAGITAFLILFFNQSKVAIMKFTGYRMLKNISDTGKAFLLILVTDIFLGYHSESGWQTLIESLLEHYGVKADQSAITIFICTVPVTIDVCFKLWVFKYLPRLSPTTAATFHEMKRH